MNMKYIKHKYDSTHVLLVLQLQAKVFKYFIIVNHKTNKLCTESRWKYTIITSFRYDYNSTKTSYLFHTCKYEMNILIKNFNESNYIILYCLLTDQKPLIGMVTFLQWAGRNLRLKETVNMRKYTIGFYH